MRSSKALAVFGALMLVAIVAFGVLKTAPVRFPEPREIAKNAVTAQDVSPDSAPEPSQFDPQVQYDSPSHSQQTAALLQSADAAVLEMLRPWVDEFVQVAREKSVKGPVIEYEIVSMDNYVLSGIQNGMIGSYVFNFGTNYRFEIDVRQVSHGEGFVLVRGPLHDQSSASSSSLVIYDDGTVEGFVGVPNLGGFYIKATPQPPYHIAFHMDGAYNID